MSVDLYTGTTRPGRNPHSCCTLIGTVVVSVASLGVHSCSWSGITRHHNRSLVVKISPIGETESQHFYNVFMVWLSDMIFNGIRQTPGNFTVYADYVHNAILYRNVSSMMGFATHFPVPFRRPSPEESCHITAKSKEVTWRSGDNLVK